MGGDKNYVAAKSIKYCSTHIALYAPVDQWVSIIFAYRIASTLVVDTAATGVIHAVRCGWLPKKRVFLDEEYRL